MIVEKNMASYGFKWKDIYSCELGEDQFNIRRMIHKLFGIWTDKKSYILVATCNTQSKLKPCSVLYVNSNSYKNSTHDWFYLLLAASSSNSRFRVVPKSKQLHRADSSRQRQVIRVYSLGYISKSDLHCAMKVTADSTTYRCKLNDLHLSEAVTTATATDCIKNLPFYVMQSSDEAPSGKQPRLYVEDCLRKRLSIMAASTSEEEEELTKEEDRLALYMMCAAVACNSEEQERHHFLKLELALIKKRLKAVQLQDSQLRTLSQIHKKSVEAEINWASSVYFKQPPTYDSWFYNQLQQLRLKLNAIIHIHSYV